MVAAPRQPDSGAFQPPGLWCPPSAPVLPCQQWSGGAPGPAINIQPPFSVVTWGGPWFVPSGPDVGYWPGPSAVAGEWPVAGAAPCCWTPGAPVGAPAALLGSLAATKVSRSEETGTLVEERARSRVPTEPSLACGVPASDSCAVRGPAVGGAAALARASMGVCSAAREAVVRGGDSEMLANACDMPSGTVVFLPDDAVEGPADGRPHVAGTGERGGVSTPPATAGGAPGDDGVAVSECAEGCLVLPCPAPAAGDADDGPALPAEERGRLASPDVAAVDSSRLVAASSGETPIPLAEPVAQQLCSGQPGGHGCDVRGAGVLRASVTGDVLARAGRVVCGQRRKVAAARVAGYNDAEVYVSGYVQDRRVDWLLDTGAQCSVISSDVIENMDVQRIPALRQPVTVDGNALDLDCVILCDVSVGDKTLRDQPLYVVRHLSPSCILGTDLLKKMGSSVSIDFATHTVSVRKCGVTESADCVRLSETVHIPPKHQSIVMCSVPRTVAAGDVVVESSELLSDRYSLLAARSVATVSQGSMIPVRILNPTSRGVTVPAHAVVARLMDSSRVVERELREGDGLDDAWVDTLVDGSDLSDESQKAALSELLRNHREAFSLGGELGQCGIVEHSIPLVSGARPISQPPRRVNVNDRDDVDAAIQKMQRDGIIRPSCSPWSSPVVPVRKRDGSLRLCIDYRRLNDLTHGDSHPLPRVEDCLDALSGSSWFSVLDLQSGYWQQEVRESDREKTAFSSHTGLWEFQRMPFGLKGAPASFQRLMMAVLAGLTWRECLVYLDDVIIFGKSFDEALNHLDHVLRAVKGANLKLNLRKCSFFKEEVKFLGHSVSSRGVAPDPDKVSSVRDFSRPQNVQDVRRFIGLASYFRKFMPQFSTVAKPLLRLTEDRARFVWDESCETSFCELKRLLTTAPVLAFPDFDEEFVLTTDASSIGLGAVLSQRISGSERPVAYASRCLTKVEARYSATERECLAVVWAVRHFAVYLQGRQFTLQTDHCPLTFLRACKDPRGRLARWILELEQFPYRMMYRRGRDIPHADALSRSVPEPVVGQIDLKSDEQRILVAQRSDPDLLYVVVSMSHGLPSTDSPSATMRHYFGVKDALEIDSSSGLLYIHADGCRRLVVPASMVDEVLSEAHDSRWSGHLGVAKTAERLKKRFYWPKMAVDVAAHVKSCAPCSQKKSPSHPFKAGFGEMPLPSRPWDWISTDITGPFPTSDSGNRYILVVVCGFSKWVEAFPIPNQEAETVARVLVRELFCRYGCPSVIHSDQGRNFESRLFKEVCQHLNIDKTRTTGYHPSGNGQVERFNKTLCAMMATFVSENQRDWDTVVPKVVFAYNTSKHETTGVTPFELFHGRSARLPLDVTCGGTECPADKVFSSRELDDIRRRVVDAITDAAEKRRQRQVVNQGQYQVGDRVWLYRAVRRRGLSPKLQKPWTGPFEITEVLSPQNYRLKGSKGRAMVVHHDHIKPFVRRRSASPHRSQASHDAVPSECEDDVVDDVSPEGDRADSDDDDVWILGYRRQVRGSEGFEAVTENAGALRTPENVDVESVAPASVTGQEADDVIPCESEGSTGQLSGEHVNASGQGTDNVTITEDEVTVPGLVSDESGELMDVNRRSTRKRSAPNRYGDWQYS